MDNVPDECTFANPSQKLRVKYTGYYAAWRLLTVKELVQMASTETVAAAAVKSEQSKKKLWQQPAAYVAVAILAFAIIVIALYMGNRASASDEQDTLLSPAGKASVPIESAPETVTPAIPKGVSDWRDYQLRANKYPWMWRSLQALHPERDVRSDVAILATNESRGVSYAVRVPIGTRFINTSYHDSKGRKWHFFRDTLEKDTNFLTFGDGTVAVKLKCGNSVRLLENVRCQRISSKRPVRPERPRRPRPPRGKGSDTTSGAARQGLQDGNAVRTATPGYEGNGDAVASEQNNTAGSTDHNDVGHAGDGSGGETQSGSNSSGETNTGGGAADTSLPGGDATPATGDTGAPQ